MSAKGSSQGYEYTIQLTVTPAAQELLKKMSDKRFKKRIERAVGDAMKLAASDLFPGQGPDCSVVPREALAQQIMRDEREEMVEDVLSDCLETYWHSGGGSNTGGCEDEAIIRSVLLTAANMWGIGRDNAQSEQQD